MLHAKKAKGHRSGPKCFGVSASECYQHSDNCGDGWQSKCGMNASVWSSAAVLQSDPEGSWWAGMDHTAPAFTPGQIDKTGKILIGTDVDAEEMGAAQAVMNSWRTATSRG